MPKIESHQRVSNTVGFNAGEIKSFLPELRSFLPKKVKFVKRLNFTLDSHTLKLLSREGFVSVLFH